MQVTTSFAPAPDGSRIFWNSRGRGAPPVLLTDGIGCAGYIWTRLAPDLARSRRVLHWNYRGHGGSDCPRDLRDATVESCVGDLLRVLDAAGEERAILVGHSMGVQMALEAHRTAPGRVAGLVLVCGSPGRLLHDFHDSSLLEVTFPYAKAFFERWPTVAAAGFRTVVRSEIAMEYALAFEVNRERIRKEDLRRYFDDLANVDPGVFVRLLESAETHDATDHLADVDVPTLVVAGERDGFTPMRLSIRMHEAIAGSELLVLPGGTHAGPLEHPELVSRHLRAFLASRFPAPKGRPAAARPARRRKTAARTAGRARRAR
jgi:pimeloyl-ACP methyl ester carboxylesterase